jgi:selenide,water dikinase
MLEIGVSTATDITGFGLIGHLFEVLSASDCYARIFSGQMPFFKDTEGLIEKNIVPGGTLANMKSYEMHVIYENGVSDTKRILMNDAQTSGGLLIFVPDEKKDLLIKALRKEGVPATHIGELAKDPFANGKRIHVDT